MLPMESMKSGGMLWFTDLTVADPYYVLPVLSALTMLLTVEMATETGGVSTPQTEMMKPVMRIMCFLTVPISCTFPTAVLNYWVTANIFSLGQSFLLKRTAVREYFGIPLAPIVHQANPNVKPGTFMENMRAGYKNAQVRAEHVEKDKHHRRFDDTVMMKQNKKFPKEQVKVRRKSRGR